MSCSCTGNCDLISINNLVLSDTFHTWYDRTNEIIDAVNPIQVYDVNVGLTDGGLTSQTTCIGGNSNGVITLKVQPGPGIGVGTTVTPGYYLNHTMIDVSNMTTKGLTGFDDAVIANRPSAAFPSVNDWYIVSDVLDASLGSGAGTPKRVKANHILPPTVYLPNGFQFNGDISINGNLSIQGTQSNIDSNDLRIEDKLIELAFHRLVSIDVTGPTYGNTFLTPGLTMYYYDPGVGNTAAYTTVGQISEVKSLDSGKTNIKLHNFSEGGVNDIVAGGRLSVTGSYFDFTMAAGPTTTDSFYTDKNLQEAGLYIHGSEGDKYFIWTDDWGPTPVTYKAFISTDNLGVSGDSKAIISSQFKAYGYNTQNDNKFHFVGYEGAAPSIRLGGLGTGSDQYGYWSVTRQNYGLTGAQQPLVFTFKPFAATGEVTEFTIWSGASGSTFPTTTVGGQGNNRVGNFAHGLNVDFLDGAHGITVPTAWSIPIALSTGKIDPNWVDSNAITKCYTVANHGFRVGDVLRLNPDNGSLTGAQANSRQNAEVLGIVSTVADSSNFCIVTKGFISGFTASPGSNINAIFPLVTGNAYFLSPDNPGRMVGNPDSVIEFGEVRKPLMVALSSDSAYIHNYLGVVEGDETDIVDVQGLHPIGMIMPYSGITGNIPYGWLACDGSRLERDLWYELFEVIGQKYGFSGLFDNTYASGNVPIFFQTIDNFGGGGTRGLKVNDAIRIEDPIDPTNFIDTYVTLVTATKFEVPAFDPFFTTNQDGKYTIRGTSQVEGKTKVFFLPDSRARVLMGEAQAPFPVARRMRLGEIGGANFKSLIETDIPPHQHRLRSLGVSFDPGASAGVLGFDIVNDPQNQMQWAGIGNEAAEYKYTSFNRGAQTAFDNRPSYLTINWIIRARKGLSAMILSGHNHDDRYIRYDASQTLTTGNRSQFRSNAKVLRNDADDTFAGNLAVTGSMVANLHVGGATLGITGNGSIGGNAVVGGSLTAGNTTIVGSLTITGGVVTTVNGTSPNTGFLVVKDALTASSWGSYTPVVDVARKFYNAAVKVIAGDQYSAAVNLFNNNTNHYQGGAGTDDQARINFFGVAAENQTSPRYSSSVGFAIRGPGASDEYGVALGSNYEYRVGMNIAGSPLSNIDETAFIATRRSDQIGDGSIRYKMKRLKEADPNDETNEMVVQNSVGELRKAPVAPRFFTGAIRTRTLLLGGYAGANLVANTTNPALLAAQENRMYNAPGGVGQPQYIASDPNNFGWYYLNIADDLIPTNATGVLVQWNMMSSNQSDPHGTNWLASPTGEDPDQDNGILIGSLRTGNQGNYGGFGGQTFIPIDNRGLVVNGTTYLTKRRIWYRFGGVGDTPYYTTGDVILSDFGLQLSVIGWF